MSSANNSLDRPLGQSPRAPRGPSRRLSFSWGGVGLTLAAVVLVAASGAIALREKPFRVPASVVAAPETTAPAGPATASDIAAAAPPKPAAAADGPSIIHVDPDAARSGGNVVVIRDPSAIGQNLRVAHLPDKALIETSTTGPLPIRAADGRRPFDVYARPWSGARGARVVIVIGGLGVSQTGTQAAIAKLPAEVTLAFASQGNSLGRWMQTARQKGHEIVMQVPLEPYDYPNVNPGRNTLTVAASAGEERRGAALVAVADHQLYRRDELHGRTLLRRSGRHGAGHGGTRQTRTALSR